MDNWVIKSASVSGLFDLEVEPAGPVAAVSDPFDIGVEDVTEPQPDEPVRLVVGTTAVEVHDDHIRVESELPVITNGDGS